MEEVYMTFPQSLCLDHTPQFQQLVYALLKLFKRLRHRENRITGCNRVQGRKTHGSGI